MAFVDIDDSLNVSEELSDLLLTFMQDAPEFSRSLTVYEILKEKPLRKGLNSDLLTSAITSRFKEIGIPSGPLVNGATNVMEALVAIICEEFVDAIQSQMRVDVAIFPGGTVQASGANAGGPVVAIGATVTAQSGIGVAV